MAQAWAQLLEAEPSGKPGKRRIRPELWPSPDVRDVGVRGDLHELQGLRAEEAATFSGQTEPRKFVDVVADVMARRMETDARLIFMGEHVHRLKGSTNGPTRGLPERFPDHILGTPTPEHALPRPGRGRHMEGRSHPRSELK